MTEPRSACHNAPVKLSGGQGDFSDQDEVVTMSYICTVCGQPCDLPINKPTGNNKNNDNSFTSAEPTDINKVQGSGIPRTNENDKPILADVANLPIAVVSANGYLNVALSDLPLYEHLKWIPYYIDKVDGQIKPFDSEAMEKVVATRLREVLDGLEREWPKDKNTRDNFPAELNREDYETKEEYDLDEAVLLARHLGHVTGFNKSNKQWRALLAKYKNKEHTDA